MRRGYSNASVVLSALRPSVHFALTCEHDRDQTVKCTFIKLDTNIAYDEKMNPIDFQGQRSKGQVHNG